MLVSDLLLEKSAKRGTGIVRTAPRSLTHEMADAAEIPVAAWQELAARAVEPNVFYEAWDYIFPC